MDVVPTFYTAEGIPIVGQTIQLQPAEIRFVDVDDLIPAEHRGQHRWGGMSLSYTGRFMEVWAQLTLRGVGGRNSVDVLFTVINAPRSNIREAVWRMPPNSTAAIALGNFSEALTTATLTFSNGETQSVTIEPFATEVVRRRANGRDEGASVTINSSGQVGRLITSGLVTTVDGKFTSSIRFFDTQNMGQPNLYATNFKLKDAVPHLLLKNTTTATVTARPRFLSASGEDGNPVELPLVTIPPNRVVAVNLQSLTATMKRRQDLASVSVQIISGGTPGSLIGALYSTDAVTGITNDVPFRDVANPRTSTGGYPVRLEGDFTTVLSITNVSSVPSKYTMQINYEGGSYALYPREIAAGATATFDIRKLRDRQTPDNTGKTLPRTLTVGQIRWSVHGDSSTRLVGRAEVISAAKRVSNSYSCMCCPNGVYDARLIRAGTLDYPGDTAQFFAMQRDQDCYGNIFNELGASSFVSYTSGDYSVADVVNASGVATAMGAGSTFIQGTWTAYEWHEDLHGTCESTPVEMEPMEEVLVRPQITSISPERGLIGSTISVTIEGTGFGADATVNVSGTGITATVTSRSATMLAVNFAVAVNAADNQNADRTVTVTSNGMTSNASMFFAQVPVSLRPITVPGAPNGVGPLQTPVNEDVIDLSGRVIARNVCGVYRNYAYILADQYGQRITQAYTITENFGGYRGFAPPGPQSQTFNIPANRELLDTQATVLSGRCLASFNNETFTQSFVVPIGGTNRGLLTIFEFNNGNFNGTLKIDRTILQ